MRWSRLPSLPTRAHVHNRRAVRWTKRLSPDPRWELLRAARHAMRRVLRLADVLCPRPRDLQQLLLRARVRGDIRRVRLHALQHVWLIELLRRRRT